ncbi:LbetaH domain-containing protein [Actinomadura macrotermitis]|uniref:Uncharacterized protein n=1 Tax=Actinomadura macrotermitis TaxID=2585200 RepID=A0A7K0C5Q6_9ACTN|nr:hypothetical protein [Actinomadura macrotermitis]MQY08775.1 hypothetical protein [Actinomadura macrotermitis]
MPTPPTPPTPADPTLVHPMPGQRRVVLLKPLITSPLIAGGNPAKLLRRRYPDRDIDRLLALAWWDWPLPHITEHLRTIMSGGIEDLEKAAPTPPHVR